MKEQAKAITLIIIGLAILTPFASPFPDGLETVIEHLEIETPEPFWHGIMPDYSIPLVENVYASTFLSGIIGTLLVFMAAFLVGKAVAFKSAP
ncbi:MAG: PDGLE domain-containing protein [Candidatus Bathyarchaeia archaeon]